MSSCWPGRRSHCCTWSSCWPAVALLHLVELVAWPAVAVLAVAELLAWPAVALLHVVELVARLAVELPHLALARRSSQHRRSADCLQFVPRFHCRARPMNDPHRLTWRPCQVGAATISGACIGACNERKR